MRVLGRLSLAAVVCGLAACELFTHAFDFRVGPSSGSAVCMPCPNGGDGRRPPCPPAVSTADPGRSFLYAARRASLGHAAGPAPLFDLGLDLDCSDRLPQGVPVLCAPRSTAGWQPLPHGVDDALLTQVLGPVYAAWPPSRAVDLDASMSGALEQGRYGVMVAVDGWNGLPDDPGVEVTLRTSPGLAQGALPAWSGADRWLPYPDVDDDGVRRFALDRAPGYVTGGTLVVDARSLGASLYRFGPDGARFELLLSDLTFTGELTRAALARFTMTGVIDQPSAGAAATALAASLATCAGGAAGPFFGAFSAQVAVAADMPFVPDADRGAPCDGISFAWTLDAEPALLARGTSSEDAGAAPLCP